MKSEKVTSSPDLAPSKDATSQAAAQTARTKAVRPWFRKKRFVLPSALILVLVIGLAASGGFGRTPTPANTPVNNGAPPTASSAVAAGIGTMLRDGSLEFVATGVERPGKTLAGKAHETLTAQGEFVIVRVNVTNIGTGTQPPNCSCQILTSDKGQKFTPSPAILSTKDALKFVQHIPPGDTVVGVLMLFDVPPGTKLASIELHGNPTSHGVKIDLS